MSTNEVVWYQEQARRTYRLAREEMDIAADCLTEPMRRRYYRHAVHFQKKAAHYSAKARELMGIE